MRRLQVSTALCALVVVPFFGTGIRVTAQTVSSKLLGREWITSRYFESPRNLRSWSSASSGLSGRAIGYEAPTYYDGQYTYRAILMAGAASGVNAVPSADSPAARVDANLNTSPYYGVPSIFVNNPGTSSDIICSGVAISLRQVLTAGHCVDLNASSGIDTVSPSIVSVKFNGASATDITVSSITMHPSFPGFSTGTADDLAILHLSSDIPAAIPKYTILPSSQLNPVSDKFRIEIVGYGRSGDGPTGYGSSSPNLETRTVKRTGANLVESGSNNFDAGEPVVPETFRYDFEPTIMGSVAGETPPHYGSGDNYSWYQGDLSKNVYSAVAGSTISRTLGNGVETLGGPGDSGGPVFVKDAQGNRFLAGIVTFESAGLSSVSGGYGSIGGGVWLGGYESFIEANSTALYANPGDFMVVPEPRDIAFGVGSALVVWAVVRRRGVAVRPSAAPPTCRARG